jgi:hypothetical protein
MPTGKCAGIGVPAGPALAYNLWGMTSAKRLERACFAGIGAPAGKGVCGQPG